MDIVSFLFTKKRSKRIMQICSAFYYIKGIQDEQEDSEGNNQLDIGIRCCLRFGNPNQ
jgi:hypothetical protein